VRDDAGRARHVLDDHRLAERPRHAIGQEPRHHVGRSARAGRNDQLDRARRPGLRIRIDGGREQDTAKQRVDEKLHDVLPKISCPRGFSVDVF
jgi:hypothetical protein